MCIVTMTCQREKCTDIAIAIEQHWGSNPTQTALWGFCLHGFATGGQAGEPVLRKSMQNFPIVTTAQLALAAAVLLSKSVLAH